jgi:hypothetical protein
MTKHRGEIVQKAVRASNMTLAAIARQIGYDRTSLYNFFLNPELPFDIIIKIGKVIHYDFRKDFPELFIHNPANIVSEPEIKYQSQTLNDCLKEKENWRSKYYALLEEHNDLLRRTKP